MQITMPRKSKQQGVALLVVIWMIMVMLTLTASLIYATRNENSMVNYTRSTATARALADAATHYTVLQLFLPQTERDLKIGGTPLMWEYDQHKIEIRVVGENGLIDLNFASRDLIKEALKKAGLEDQACENMLDLIEDFRDVDDLKRLNGAEDKDYEQAGLLAGSKDAPFERIEELQQVMGMTPALYQVLTRYFTVNSGVAGINPMLAPRQTLLILAEGDEAKVDDYIKRRDEANGDYIQPDFGKNFLENTQQFFYRLQIRIYGDDNAPPYFEERSLKLTPEKNPPFVTYFKQMQESKALFGQGS